MRNTTVRTIARGAAAMVVAGIGCGVSLQVQAQGGPMPFTVKVTKVPVDDAPEYMGRVHGMDFPFCGVKIEDEYWILLGNAGGGPSRWKGTNFVTAVKQPDGRNENRKHVERPYMLGGMWYDEVGKRLYAPMHCETHKGDTGGHGPNPMDRQIHLSSSDDKGATWKYEGPIVTRDDPKAPWRTVYDFSGPHWDGGDGDFCFFVDTRGGYLYLYSNHYTWPKRGGATGTSYLRHRVARCAIADKMAPGKWKKFHNGKWEEPGLGGKASFVDAYYVMYNTYLKKYISFNYGAGISVCSDMEKQDWSPSYEIQPAEAWGTAWGKWFGCGGWHVMNEDCTDIYDGGRTLYFYKYWMGYKPECYRLDLDAVPAKTNYGYHPTGGYGFSGPTTFSGPLVLYGNHPFYDSADPIESRRTRRIERDSAEVTASPGWDKDRVSGTAGSSLEIAFKAADVYWRAARGPGMGKADVYLDGALQATVDTWASFPTADMFAYLKTGLDPTKAHTLKIVVRGEKNWRATGAAIAHLCFEYSAESWRASYGFSSVQGKDPWRYQAQRDEKIADLFFQNGAWSGTDGAGIGFDAMWPGTGAVVRTWIAPRGGSVRIQGSAEAVRMERPAGPAPVVLPKVGETVADPADAGELAKNLETPERMAPEGVRVKIAKNNQEVWPVRLISYGKQESHDLALRVVKGDAIAFSAEKGGANQFGKVLWDPAVTYADEGQKP
jgi:hypothetical protein